MRQHTSTQVLALLVQQYLLYLYKSTNTDAEEAGGARTLTSPTRSPLILSTTGEPIYNTLYHKLSHQARTRCYADVC